jgi:hypothetical protein
VGIKAGADKNHFRRKGLQAWQPLALHQHAYCIALATRQAIEIEAAA